MKIGFIGIGKMATAIIQGLKQEIDYDILISQSSFDKTQKKAVQLTVFPARSHQDLINQSDLIVLGIKPQILEEVLKDLTITKPILSMVAGKPLEELEALTSHDLPILRIMPNLNAQILKSTTALCYNAAVSDSLYQTVVKLVEAFGTCFTIPEREFDSFTALAGSSPAYIAMFIEAMTKAGVKFGFSKETALAIVTETLIATGEILKQNHEKPSDFIDRVASPGGITIEGLLTMEKTGFTPSVISTLEATVDKSRQMSNH